MEFEHEKHEAAFRALEAHCTPDKGFQAMLDEAPGFAIRNENALVLAMALPWGSEHAVIQVRGLMVRNVPFSTKAAQWLLEQNDNTVLGAFGWSNESGLFFGHTILADDLDESEITASIIAVATTSNAAATEILEEFGGKRFFED